MIDIEKFDIGILNYGRIEPDNLDGDLCMVSESDLDNFTEQYKKMLMALIGSGITNHWFSINMQRAVEKATGKTWDEIKELINE